MKDAYTFQKLSGDKSNNYGWVQIKYLGYNKIG